MVNNKYAKRSATQRRCYLDRLKALCESRGDVFICLDTNFDSAHSYGIYFERSGEVKSQNVHSYKRGLRLQEDYLKSVQRYPKGKGLYKFYIKDELVYLGKTKDFNLRFQGHFKTYKNPEHYKTTIGKNKDFIDKIEICHLNESDSNIYEMYLLAKYKPKFNDKDVPADEPSFDLPELEFQELTGWR